VSVEQHAGPEVIVVLPSNGRELMHSGSTSSRSSSTGPALWRCSGCPPLPQPFASQPWPSLLHASDSPAQGILEELLGKVLATKRLTAMQLGAPRLPPTSW
jgi:hypothetical protein